MTLAVRISGSVWTFFSSPSVPASGRTWRILNRDNLFHVQLSDLADVARELASDADRIMPGEGDLPVSELIRTAAKSGI